MQEAAKEAKKTEKQVKTLKAELYKEAQLAYFSTSEVHPGTRWFK